MESAKTSDRALAILIKALLTGEHFVKLPMSDDAVLELARKGFVSVHAGARMVYVTDRGINAVIDYSREQMAEILVNTGAPAHLMKRVGLGILAVKSIRFRKIEEKRGARFMKRKPKMTRRQHLDRDYFKMLERMKRDNAERKG
jgi:hypothetical protein